MVISGLRSILESVGDSFRTELARNLEKHSDLPAHVMETLSLGTSIDAIREFLASQPEYQGCLLLRRGNGGVGATFIIPQALARRVIAQGVDSAMLWYERVMKLDEAQMIHVVPIWGVKIEESVSLGENISIVPFSDVPNSFQKTEIEKRKIPQAGISMFAIEPPESAIVISYRLAPLFARREEDVHGNDEYIKHIRFFEELRLCLVVACVCAIVPGIKWQQFIDQDLIDFNMGDMYWSHDEIRPSVLHRFGDVDVPLVQRLVIAYFKLADEDRDRIRLSLDRFDRSMRRSDGGDAALELAIALEALLGDGSAELTWKVGLRSALLLEGTKAEKIRLRAVVHAVYSLRSKLAHTGRTPSEVKTKIGKLKAHDLRREGAIAVASVIRAAIFKGKLPDWFEEEISAG